MALIGECPVCGREICVEDGVLIRHQESPLSVVSKWRPPWCKGSGKRAVNVWKPGTGKRRTINDIIAEHRTLGELMKAGEL